MWEYVNREFAWFFGLRKLFEVKYKEICSYFENEFSINPLQRVFEKHFKSHVNYEKDEFYYKEFIEKLIETHIENKDNENKISYYEMMNFLCDAHVSADKGFKEEMKKKVIDCYKNDKLFHYSLFLFSLLNSFANFSSVSSLFSKNTMSQHWWSSLHCFTDSLFPKTTSKRCLINTSGTYIQESLTPK